ncbi:60S ribosomal protein L29 [Fulvia fulva]|uniref:Large ribosomal subunit protein eL29 n=1 Tax=Passalora fulva TaxID=5499 RepID=A0A9Q8PJV1_PASFU|nr:60S ribosomal protein L29 [Fulvia fulva]KAK4612141.1 60S ribosomal protein L29 [Fulvia fulva]UJO23750.1 60S ribosomal protein L29 [Fulvia fulva]WPV20905.1 60S ribosomal protein L29 [Fulvia fulva]WPV36379.1 60S ribosomal protein L29 [Fulvia fulva]
MDAEALRLLGDPQITKVPVGQSEHEFSIHTRLLCHYSAYFRLQYASETQEAQKNTFYLPALATGAFSTLQAWLYQCAVNYNTDREPEFELHHVAIPNDRERRATVTWSALIDLYIVAHHLDALKLRNKILTRLQAEYDGQTEIDDDASLPTAANVCTAWTGSQGNSHLCRWLTTAFAFRWRCWEVEAEEMSKFPGDFRTSVMKMNSQRIHEKRWDEEPNFANNLSLYHDHHSREEREQCQRVRGEKTHDDRVEPGYAQPPAPDSQHRADVVTSSDETKDADDDPEDILEPGIVKIEAETGHAIEDEEGDTRLGFYHPEDGDEDESDNDKEAISDHVAEGLSSTDRTRHDPRRPDGQANLIGRPAIRAPTLDPHELEALIAEPDEAVVDVADWNTPVGETEADWNKPVGETEADGSISPQHAQNEGISEFVGSDYGTGWNEQAFEIDLDISSEGGDRMSPEDQPSDEGDAIHDDGPITRDEAEGRHLDHDITIDGDTDDERDPTTTTGPRPRGRPSGTYNMKLRRPRQDGEWWSQPKAAWRAFMIEQDDVKVRKNRGNLVRWTHAGNIMENPALQSSKVVAMAKSKNSSQHNQSKKAHRNGIKKPKTHRYPSLKGTDPKFRRNHRHALHGTMKALKEVKEGKRDSA